MGSRRRPLYLHLCNTYTCITHITMQVANVGNVGVDNVGNVAIGNDYT